MSLTVKEEDSAPEDVEMEGAQPVDVKQKDAEPDVKKPDVKVKVKKEEKVKKEPKMRVKKEVKKEKKEKPSLEDLIPLPKTTLTAPKRRGRLRYDFGSLIKSYPWREKPENSNAKTMGLEARRLLDLLGEPPSKEHADLEMDRDVSNIRELEVHELVQKVIDEQLEKEDLLGFYGDERVPINRSSRMGAYDYDSPPPSDMEQEASAPSSSSRVKKEEPSSSSAQVEKEPSQVKEELKEEKEEAKAGTSLPSYKELALQRWKKCSKLRTGMLLLECPEADEWQKNCRKNAVHGNPHKRALNRILAKYTSEYPQSQECETDCVRPDLSSVPDTVKLVQAEEMIFTVAVCDKRGMKQQEYDILGSQSLHDLKDAFYFVSDWTYDGQRRINSGCMFIDGVFYSDMRSKHSVDYAPYLIEHLQGSEKVREPKSCSMSIRLCELERIPYGEKCCYVRQGDLEHSMYFTGVRLFNMGNDCPFYDSYPVCIFMATFQKRFCASCAQNLAVWVVHGAARLPVDPMHLCCLCFDRFFKDKQGQLIKPADYNVFPYLHD